MEKYIPDMYKKSIYDINFDRLKEIGINVLLLDLDNTLMEYSNKQQELKQELIDFIGSLKNKGFNLIIYSNSSKKRVNYIKEKLDIDGVARAMKPNKKGFDKLIQKYKLDNRQIAIIGDQIMTDIKGGNKAEITTILVNPISKKEPFFTKINRFRENIKLRKLREKSLFIKGKFYE